MNLIEQLESIKSKNVLVIGDIMLDRYYFGISKRISPEAPVPVLLKKDEKIVLGGAANVAINVKKAGQKVSVLSVIGDDIEGDILISLFKESGIDDSLIIKDENRCTSVKNRFIGQNNIQMFRLDEEVTKCIDEDITNKLLKLLQENIKKYDVVIISDYNKGLLNIQNTKNIIKIANENGVKTLIDIKEPVYEKYKEAYLIKPNLEELKQITNMKVDTEKQIENAAKTLLKESDCKYVLVTRGKDGMMLVSKEYAKSIQCMSREVYDVTGAGDTVISYLAVCMINNMELIDSIQVANYAAGVEVSKMGTYAVSIEEIKRYINEDNSVHYDDKILTANELVKVLANKRDKKIVFTNGCFDIFHVGHSRYLAKAASYGDLLIVAVNSDASVKRLKGETRPIVSEEERMELLAGLECVSYVVKFEEDTPYELIKKIKPNIITKGGDYKPEEVVGKDIVEEYGGQVIICPFIEGKSTTNIINKIKER